jgi:small multidrug resistance family-3 protein
MLESLGLFAFAGLCEIGGGYLVWLWLREDKGWLWGWGIDRRPPDLFDAIGAGICLVGVAVIM